VGASVWDGANGDEEGIAGVKVGVDVGMLLITFVSRILHDVSKRISKKAHKRHRKNMPLRGNLKMYEIRNGETWRSSTGLKSPDLIKRLSNLSLSQCMG